MKNLLLLPSFLLLSFGAFAQVKYLNNDYKEVENESLATYKQEIIMSDSIAGIRKISYISGKPKMEESFSNMKKAILSGKCQYWFDNGELKEVVNYYENKFDGTVSTYYKGGQLKRKDIYKLDSLVEGHCYDSTGAEKNHTVFHKRPEFPGGTNTLLNFLSRNLKYPSVSRRLGIEGKVLVQFVVNPNGQIINARIKQGLTTDLDTEALRVVNSLPSWEPGIHDGEKVNFNYLLPIVFRLQ